MICSVAITAEEVAHIDISLFLFLFLFLLLWLSGGISTGSGSSCCATSSWGTSADVGEKLVNVLSLESLDEKSWPVAFNGDLGGAENLVKLLFLKNANHVIWRVKR